MRGDGDMGIRAGRVVKRDFPQPVIVAFPDSVKLIQPFLRPFFFHTAEGKKYTMDAGIRKKYKYVYN